MHSLKILIASLAVVGLVPLTASGATPTEGQMRYCKADVQRLCKGVEAGNGRLLQCLKTHENDLSVGCAKELKAMKSKKGT